MDEQENVLEETLDTVEANEDYIDETEYADDTDDQEEPEADKSDVEDDAEIEYDEEGNVVEHVAEEGEDATTREGAEEVSNDTEAATARDVKHADEGGEDFRAKYEALLKQTGDTLKKLGVETEDALEGLESLAADADGVTLEEYRSKKQETERTEKAQKLLQQQEFERMAAQDLISLQSDFPETRAYKTLIEMPPTVLKRFGELRGMGLSAKEAYAAANPDGVRNSVASSVKKAAMHESKTHLQTTVPKTARNTEVRMTRAQLEEYRAIFPGYSDKKIVALYKQTTKN